MNAKPESVNKGGVMRCCVETWETDVAARTHNPPHGTILPCRHCTSSLIYEDTPERGVWRWNK